MNLTSKDKNWLIFGVISLLLTGATLIGATTITPSGGYDTPWWNASVGINAPDLFRGGENFTAWIMSTFVVSSGSVIHDQDLNTTDPVDFQGVDVGWIDLDGVNRTTWPSGVGEIHDQDLNTTDNVDFASVNATNEFYRNGANYTAQIEALIEALIAGRPGNFTLAYEDMGAPLGPHTSLNFIEGENITLTLIDDAPNDQINITITSTGGGGGGWPIFDQDLNTTDDVEFASMYSGNWTLSYPEGLANNATTGIVIKGQAGEALNFGDACFLESDGDYMKSDSNSSATMFVVAIATEKMENDEVGHFLIEGYIRCDSWYELTIGSAEPILAGWIPGTITQTIPDSAGDQVQRIGYPIAAKIIRFDPDNTVIEIT